LVDHLTLDGRVKRRERVASWRGLIAGVGPAAGAAGCLVFLAAGVARAAAGWRRLHSTCSAPLHSRRVGL